MEPAQIRIILFVAGVALVSALLGYLLIRKRVFVAFFGLIVAALAAGVYFMLLARAGQGWDALGYFLIVLLLVAPAMAGLGIGGGIAWWRGRMAR
ncbi:MAG: hypothetical protein RID15_03495 [Marinovum algicola]|jgi:hypothetical protein|uniref:Uncharacterized protein n=1 Tax=Marinovum algicola TaxID=42444 RepID=A0A975ZMG9_9RHOB|nr:MULTISPECIES: hypothetical protein [Marinovum]AKO96261.1 hypothetical protein MALG_01073 [Marinovum algicola DG 898]MDD9738742.1 hypothetical protein [Marinovum sp. SP66]MDD9743413.1 hypothetical protein [Marinovum sp. PR37]SEI93984.1 hypothetical protein SAMN04487940_102423 [Marinovum algicola]SLN11219.1 hypothetical protein MAA5396_00090 [Marinovum algicola]